MRPGQKITLYHFCAAHDLHSILNDGITKGCTPIFERGQLRVARKTQWLTADSDPGHQSWNTQQVLPYSRTAYRLTVNIPYSHRKKLIRAKEFIERYPEENANLVTKWTGSENWYVFSGVIPSNWIGGYKKMKEV